MMSTLISGSTAMHSPIEDLWPSKSRLPAPYISFADPYQSRYLPPRSNYNTSPDFDAFGSAKVPRAEDQVSQRPILHQDLATFHSSDFRSHMPHDVSYRPGMIDSGPSRRQSQESYGAQIDSPLSQNFTDHDVDDQQRILNSQRGTGRFHTRRRPFNQDEFDGPSQYLPLPLPHQDIVRAQALPDLPYTLIASEQDEILQKVNEVLSECAFHFVAKYQFPIPLERDKPRIRSAADREWTEWAYLLKRLATKRRIPARVLFENQIKQFVTILENSIATRQGASKDQPISKQKLRDDWCILQLISAALQVTKILMDSQAMDQLYVLYKQTSTVIYQRQNKAEVSSGFQRH